MTEKQLDATAEQTAETERAPTRREARRAARPINQQALDELAARESEQLKTEQAAQTARGLAEQAATQKMADLVEIQTALTAVQAAVAGIPKSGSALGSSIEAIKENAREGLQQVHHARQALGGA